MLAFIEMLYLVLCTNMPNIHNSHFCLRICYAQNLIDSIRYVTIKKNLLIFNIPLQKDTENTE